MDGGKAASYGSMGIATMEADDAIATAEYFRNLAMTNFYRKQAEAAVA